MLRWSVQVLKVLVTAAILGLFAWHFDFRSTVGTLSTISVYALPITIGLVLIQVLILAMRLTDAVSLFRIRFGIADSCRLTLESMFFSQTFISFLGADALRIWRIQRVGLPLDQASSIVVLDRLVGMLANHLFLIASLPWLLPLLPPGATKLLLIALAAGGVVGFALVLLLGFLRGRVALLRRLPKRMQVTALVALLFEVSTIGRHFLESWRCLTSLLILSGFVALCNATVFAAILLAMDVPTSLALECALFVPAILEVAMLPISIAGWGVREGAAVVAFGGLGLSPDRALGASVTFGLVLAVVSLLGGLLWLLDRREMSITVEPERGARALCPASVPNDRHAHQR
jgi:glycosyltransferase 2 family protein